MSAYTVQRFEDPSHFQASAGPFLLASEAEYNLLFGILEQLRSGRHEYRPPIYLAAVLQDGRVCGCAFRTPPFKLGLTHVPTGALRPLADDVASVYSELPAVMADAETALAFAEVWCTGRPVIPVEGRRSAIFECDRPVHPRRPAAGRLIPAPDVDDELAAAWMDAFHREVDMPNADPAETVRRLGDDLCFWIDGEPRSMAGTVGPTPNGIRIGFVYTPPDLRGRGYAGTMVARLTEAQLTAGRRFCFLYTDLANPTSNALYERIGYRRITEVIDIEFVPPA